MSTTRGMCWVLGASLSLALACGAPPPKNFEAEAWQVELIEGPEPNGPFVWTAEPLDGGGGLLTMVGTVHTGTAAFIPVPALDAIADSTRYVMEMDPDALSIQEVNRRAVLPMGESLDVIMGPTEWPRVLTALNGRLGNADAVKKYKTWFVTLVLAQVNAPPSGGMDTAMRREATAQGDEVQFLETGSQQLDMLERAWGRQALVDLLNSPGREGANAQRIADAYRAGDAATIVQIMAPVTDEERSQHHIMVEERNAGWLPKLEADLAGGVKSVLAAGAVHLIGPWGVPTLLKAKGYRVKRYQPPAP